MITPTLSTHDAWYIDKKRLSSKIHVKKIHDSICGWRQNSNFLAGFLFSHGRRAGPEWARASSQASYSWPSAVHQYRVISTVIWKPVLKPGWALHSNSKYGRVNSHGPGWDSQINWDNQCSYRKLSLSSSFWTHSNIYYSWGKDYQLSPLAGLIKLKTLMVSWWSEHFSGPGCWIISGYCVRVRVTEIIRFIVWIWAFIINIRIKFKER